MARVGVNLQPIYQWNPIAPWVDAFKSARPWWLGNDQHWQIPGAYPELDANGWVRSIPPGTWAKTCILQMGQAHRPGRYLVRWDGEGRLKFGGNCRVVSPIGDNKSCWIQVDRLPNPVDSEAGLCWLEIHETNPQDHLRAIKIIHANDRGTGKRALYRQPYQERLQPFQVLRTMDWQGINNSPVTDALPDVTDAIWGATSDADLEERKQGFSDQPVQWYAKGVPIPVILRLCREVGASPWLCIPHMASDALVAQICGLAKRMLPEGQSLYLEYSNEIWNPQFSQHQWAQARAEATWGASVDAGFMRWYGRRSAECSQIGRQVFVGQPHRFKMIFATQSAWQGLEQPALEEAAKLAALRDLFAGYAIAPYYGNEFGSPENQGILEKWAARGRVGEQLAIDQLRHGRNLFSSRSLREIEPEIKYHAGVASGLGLELMAYEQNSHAFPEPGFDSEVATRFLQRMMRHPRNYQLQSEFYQLWQKHGGGLVCHYHLCDRPEDGGWGLISRLGDVKAPKYRALLDYAKGGQQ